MGRIGHLAFEAVGCAVSTAAECASEAAQDLFAVQTYESRLPHGAEALQNRSVQLQLAV
jgi:hypothetical protein